jgi:hypothetical protein
MAAAPVKPLPMVPPTAVSVPAAAAANSPTDTAINESLTLREQDIDSASRRDFGGLTGAAPLRDAGRRVGVRA